MERPLRAWVHRLLPWAAFAVALLFAFAQLAARHEAGSAAAPGPAPAAVPTGTEADPAPLFEAWPPIPDRAPQERLESLLAVARARAAALQREAAAAPEPPPPVEVTAAPTQYADPLARLLQDAVSEDSATVRAAQRRVNTVTPLHVRRIALLVAQHPDLAVGARALLDRLPPSRATDALRRDLAK